MLQKNFEIAFPYLTFDADKQPTPRRKDAYQDRHDEPLGVRPMREEFILKETADRPNTFRLGFVGFDRAGCQFVQKCREAIAEQHRRLVDFDEFFNLRISSASAKGCSCIVAAIGTETTAEQLASLFSASPSCNWKIVIVPQDAWTEAKAETWHQMADTVLVIGQIPTGAADFCTLLSTAFLPGLIGLDYEDFRTTLSDATATGYLLHGDANGIAAATQALVKQPGATRLAQTKRAVFAARVELHTAMCDLADAMEILSDQLPDTANWIFGAVRWKGMENQASIRCIIML